MRVRFGAMALAVGLSVGGCGEDPKPAEADAVAEVTAADAVADAAVAAKAETTADVAAPVDAADAKAGETTAPCPAAGCDDGNPCTSDSCSTSLGCVHGPTSKPCDDGLACTVGDGCKNGVCYGGPPNVWQKVVGGPKDDVGLALAQDGLGGIVVAGRTASKGAGGRDGWLVRLDAGGTVVWDVSHGSTADDEFHAIQPLGTGGFLVAGSTQGQGAGKRDGWLVQVGDDGKAKASHVYGGKADEEVFGLATLPDGAVFCGYSESKGTDTLDLWLVRVGLDGKVVWDKSFGKTELDAGYDLTVLPDGGFAIAGETAPAGKEHLWLLRTDAAGNLLWDKTFHGTGNDTGWAVQPVLDAGGALTGLAVAGYAHPPNQGQDMWLVRAGLDGTLVSEHTYGLDGPDEARALAVVPGGGFLLAGRIANAGAGALGLQRVDAVGKALWSKTYGGKDDEAHAVLAMAGGGFAVAGQVAAAGSGSLDLWVLRVDAAGGTVCAK